MTLLWASLLALASVEASTTAPPSAPAPTPAGPNPSDSDAAAKHAKLTASLKEAKTAS